MAQEERDPVRLAGIIDQMNCLLSWYEGRAAVSAANKEKAEAPQKQKSERRDLGQEGGVGRA